MISPIVSAEWLERNRDNVVLADVRWYLDGRSGHAAYEDGHLPGAVFVDLDRWLAAEPSREAGRHPFPSPQQFANGMAECGISSADTVVGYDDAGGVIAARLVWLLRVIGVEATLLDGGLNAYWGPLERGAMTVPRAAFTPRPWPTSRLATLHDVGTAGAVVIDARPRERYRGDSETVDARAGHIPGAINIPCREHLDAEGLLRPIDEIRESFRRSGIEAGSDVISYCGSGVTACHNLLLLDYTGVGVGKLYPGSWSQYSADESLPIATGSSPQ